MLLALGLIKTDMSYFTTPITLSLLGKMRRWTATRRSTGSCLEWCLAIFLRLCWSFTLDDLSRIPLTLAFSFLLALVENLLFTAYSGDL